MSINDDINSFRNAIRLKNNEVKQANFYIVKKFNELNVMKLNTLYIDEFCKQNDETLHTDVVLI